MRKILGTILSIILASALVYTAVAATQTNYSTDDDSRQFSTNIKDVYEIDESKDIQISFTDRNTSTKPVGYGVQMQIDNGPRQEVIAVDGTRANRIVNLGDLAEGSHRLTFTVPDGCGNFYGYSQFNSETRFDNEYDCEYTRTVNVETTFEAVIIGCIDQNANNFNSRATIGDNSCLYGEIQGCTENSASNFNPEATVDNGSCIDYVYGCTDRRALNYNSNATASNSTCEYDGLVTESTFECSLNNRIWFDCEGRTFTLRDSTEVMYVRTATQNSGTWSDWCTGDINNGVQANFAPATAGAQLEENARVGFDFTKQGTLFDMVICLDPSSASRSQSSHNIKLKLLNLDFQEN